MKATKRKTILPLLFMLFALGTSGQQKIKELKVGDRLPHLVIQRIINRSDSKVALKDLYKDGLLLIDFWFTSCVPCINEMKFLDSLKSKHPGKFNVLMVTYQDSAQIQTFLSRPSSRDIKTENLVLAVKDTILRSLFPHRIDPHNIWIDSTGTIRAITGTEEVTEQNILGFEKMGASGQLKLKKDLMTFNDMEEFHLMDTSFSYRSIITRSIPTGNGGVLAGTSKGLAYKRFFQYNSSIAHLFWSAYSIYNPNPVGSYKTGLVELHTPDSLRLVYPIDKFKRLLTGSKYKDMAEWNTENTYCYALTLPERVADTVFRRYMFDDLERRFRVRAKIENRNVPCQVVSKIKGQPLTKSKVTDGLYAQIKFAGDRLIIRNATIRDVLNHIAVTFDSRQLNDPFVTELSRTDDIRFDLDLDMGRFAESETGLRPQDYFELLRKYGYIVKKEKRSYPVLVLYDLN